jgi:AraC family transcriptional regulator of adaptative response/methylated-DNA-[protein]-cysteine methyltransferase
MHESGAAGSPHDLGMTPSQFRRGGEDASICYTIAASSIGSVLVAATPRGICRVDIADDARVLEQRLRAEYPRAAIDASDSALNCTASTIVAYIAGAGPWPLLPLDVRATAFQARVWEVLRSIAPGTTVSYAKLAEMIGSPKAARAVARACANNPAALLIPCHRIVPQSGGTGGYRWDPKRKERLLEIERGLARR